jgi:hypothetical protein
VSFADYRAWQMQIDRFALPESELRSVYETNPDGTMGRHKTPSRIHRAIGDGQKKRDYSRIRVPVMVLMDYPRPSANESQPDDEKGRAASGAYLEATRQYVDRWIANLFRGVPGARVIDVQGGHYLFLTREKEVIQEIRRFFASL